jgi:hypothetical protein
MASTPQDDLGRAAQGVDCTSCGWTCEREQLDDEGWTLLADGRVLCELCQSEPSSAQSVADSEAGEGIILQCPSCRHIQDRAERDTWVLVPDFGEVCAHCAARLQRTQRCLECARDVRETECFCFFREAWWCNECIRKNVLECQSCRRTVTLYDSLYASWQHQMPAKASSFGKHGLTYCPDCVRSARPQQAIAAICSWCGDPHDPSESVCGNACNHCTNNGVF